MSDPIKFTPSYNFTAGVPGTQVDIQLADLATSIGTIVDAIKDTRRSDGKLRNGIVGPDQLSPALSVGFTLKGVWVDGEDYDGGDAVVYGDSFYRSTVAHKAIEGNRPDKGTSAWAFLVKATIEALADVSITPAKIHGGDPVGFQEKFGLVIGVNVQAYDAKTVKADEGNTFTVSQTLFRDTAVTGSAFVFTNTNGTVGSVQIAANSTVYSTSSDERLKQFAEAYDPAEAVAVIRADPVRAWTWKSDGSPAIGWGAQTSFEVSPDLASPGHGEPGDEGFVPWGVDQSKRTPYLWAALSSALDHIDDLERRLAALEGAEAPLSGS